MNDNNVLITFNEMYEEYYRSILAYFSRSVGCNEAEDLTQQTFIRLWSYLPYQSFVRSKKSLIFKIAKSVRADYFKKKSFLSEAMYITDDFELCDSFEFERVVELKMIMDKLSTDDKSLIELKKQGFTSREIGKKLGISPSAVRTRLQSLRQKISKQL